MSILVKIIIAIITFIMTKRLYNYYKKTDSYVERTIIIVTILIIFTPITVYYIDRYNLFSALHWCSNKEECDRWFNYFSSYTPSIFAAIISGSILIVMTRIQIEDQIKNNNDDKRIQNAPIFKYIITNQKNGSESTPIIFYGDGNLYNLYINIDNIGLNHARHISIKIIEENSKYPITHEIDKCQSILKKDENIWLNIVLNYKINKNYKNIEKELAIIVYYEDLLNNKYMQQINMSVTPIDKFNHKCNGYELIINNIEIDNEKVI